MITITSTIFLNDDEVKFKFICSPGPGGQNVNKVATAVLLRFNVLRTTSLSDNVRSRLIILIGKKLSAEGDLLIKASSYRTQERNKQDALLRLCDIIKRAATPIKKRKKTRPTLASKERRLSTKKIHSKTKSLRRSNTNNDH